MYVASLILGILSLVLCWIPGVGILLSIVALIISIVAVCKKENEKSERGMSIAGLILSCVSIVFSIIIIIAMVIFANLAIGITGDILDEFKDSEFGEYISAELKLMEKYAEVEFKNENNEYTGYIDKNTGEYVEMNKGIEVDDYYEYYLENNGYDYDVYVNINGEPIIEENF